MTTIDTSAAELATRSARTLRWAATIFRPGSAERDRLHGMAASIESRPDSFRPLSGHAEARKAVAAVARTAEAALDALAHLPANALGVSCEASLRDTLRLARKDLETLDHGVVPYGDVLDALRGSWGDSDLSEDIRKLTGDLREAVEADRQAPEKDASISGGMRR